MAKRSMVWKFRSFRFLIAKHFRAIGEDRWAAEAIDVDFEGGFAAAMDQAYQIMQEVVKSYTEPRDDSEPYQVKDAVVELDGEILDFLCTHTEIEKEKAKAMAKAVASDSRFALLFAYEA